MNKYILIFLVPFHSYCQNISIAPLDSVIFQVKENPCCIPVKLKITIKTSILTEESDSLYFPEVIFSGNYVDQNKYCCLRYELNPQKWDGESFYYRWVESAYDLYLSLRDEELGVRDCINGRKQIITGVKLCCDTSFVFKANLNSNISYGALKNDSCKIRFIIVDKSKGISRNIYSDWIEINFQDENDFWKTQKNHTKSKLSIPYKMFSWILPKKTNYLWYQNLTGNKHPKQYYFRGQE